VKEQIYTIPINESFEAKSGCPLCRLYALSREKALDYITGSAMMEPNVRIQSNEKGFCREHFDEMQKRNAKLAVGLMLESHMDELEKRIYISAKGYLGKGYNPDKVASGCEKTVASCFVCERIWDDMSHYLSNIVHIWKTEPEFRRLFEEQEGFCLPHLSALLSAAKRSLNKKDLFDFTQSAVGLSKKLHDTLRGELASFTKSFDYRYASEPGNARVKSAIENTIKYLSSEKK
jgi:hypothetical protein